MGRPSPVHMSMGPAECAVARVRKQNAASVSQSRVQHGGTVCMRVQGGTGAAMHKRVNGGGEEARLHVERVGKHGLPAKRAAKDAPRARAMLAGKAPSGAGVRRTEGEGGRGRCIGGGWHAWKGWEMGGGQRGMWEVVRELREVVGEPWKAAGELWNVGEGS